MMQREFEAVWKFCEKGFGVDLGCGSNPLSPYILSIDQGAHDRPPAGPHLIGDIRRLGLGGGVGFHDEVFDFIFSSHVLEDFDDIGGVLKEWWRKLKTGGYLVLLLPDMENGRYPRVGEREGNPSHRVNVGPEFMHSLCEKELGTDAYEIVQQNTITWGDTFDFVLQKRR